MGTKKTPTRGTSTYVLATDLSRASRQGAALAANLARRSGATLDFYCAVPADAAEEMEGLLEHAREEVESLAQEHASDELATSCHVAVVRDVASAIVRHSDKLFAEMVIVAPQGATGWKKLLLGSVTESVMRQAPPALLVARGGRPKAEPKVLVAVDRTRGSVRALRKAISFARSVGAELTVLHVIRPPGRLLALKEELDGVDVSRSSQARVRKAHAEFEEWVAKVPHKDVPLTTRVVEGDAPECILAEARADGARFIVLGTHDKSRTKEFFVGSVARAVAASAPVSVLLISARPRRRRER